MIMRLLSTHLLPSLCAIFLFSIPINAQNGPDLELDTTFYVIPENAQALTHLFAPQYFAVNVHNVGDEAAAEVIVSCQVTDLTEGEVIFSVEKNYGELSPGESIENDILNEDAFNLPETSFFDERDYQGTYIVTTTSEDTNLQNDTIYFDFSSGYESFAKESGRTGGVRLEGSNYYVGTCFYVPEGYTFEVRDLEFMIDNADEVAQGHGIVTILLYETFGDQNQDGIIDTMEYGYSPVYFNEYLFDGSENQTLVRSPIHIEAEGSYDRLELLGGRYYLLVLEYVNEDEEDTMVISVSDDYDYTANGIISNQIELPQYAHVIYSDSLGGDRPNFEINGLGANVTPLIRFKPFVPIGNTQSNSLPSNYKVTIAPNPVDEQFAMTFDFPEQSNTQMALFNQEGRLIKNYPSQKIYRETILENCRNLPNGMYTLQIVTEKGNASRSIVVQH